LPLGAGITAIVGPNGCGKTNVAEAIRWALGEQAISSLRGERLEDLIFNGTKDRPPLSMAEVSLTFSNEKKILPLDYSEVMITRKIFRSGESECYINKIPCRLKDITDLFLNTGMGAHAYSSFEQRMVDEILSDDPQTRRNLFEEAAGTAKYRAQKRVALRKLEATEADLLRLNDIIQEVGRRERVLKRQARKARVHEKLKEELKNLEIELARQEYERMRDEEREAAKELKFWENKKFEEEEKLKRGEEIIVSLRNKLIENEKELANIQESINELNDQIQMWETKTLVFRERRESLDYQIKGTEEEIESKLAHLTSLEETVKQVEASSEEIHRKMLEEEEKEGMLDAELTQIEREILVKKVSLEEERKVLEKIRRREEEKNRELAALRVRKENTEENLKRFSLESSILLEERERIRKEYSVLIKTCQNFKVKIESGEEKQGRLKEFEEKLVDKIKKLEEERRKLEALLQMKENELSFLEKMRKGYEGYAEGVKEILLGEERPPGIIGILADLVDVSPEMIEVVESALDERLESVVNGFLSEYPESY